MVTPPYSFPVCIQYTRTPPPWSFSLPPPPPLSPFRFLSLPLSPSLSLSLSLSIPCMLVYRMFKWIIYPHLDNSFGRCKIWIGGRGAFAVFDYDLLFKKEWFRPCFARNGSPWQIQTSRRSGESWLSPRRFRWLIAHFPPIEASSLKRDDFLSRI